jgi:tetratricopeptide (TPR) repeat protein
MWLAYRKLYAAASTLWGIAFLLGVWNLVLPKAGPAISFTGVFSFIPLLLLLALASYANHLYLAKARKVITQARARCQSGETHLTTIARQGGTNLIAALGFPVVVLFALFGTALALNLAGLSPSAYGKRLLFNAGELYYKPPVTEQQARRLGEYLVGTHFFDGKRKTLQLARPGDTPQVRVVVKEGLERDQQMVEQFRQFGIELSRKVFDGAPLEIHLCDQWMKTLTTVSAAPAQTGSAQNTNNMNDIQALDKQYQTLRQAGSYLQAVPIAQQLLKAREELFGPENPETAMGLNNLAELYRQMGDYAKAEPLFQRALRIWEKALGPEHPNTASCLNNLAELYRQMGDYAKAEPLFQRALRIREKNLGPEHPNTAASLNGLGAFYVGMGDYAKAEPLLQRALRIWEKVLGPEHPNTAISLNNLAELYRLTADYAKAEPLYQRALRTKEKVLGTEHPGTATSLNNLATLYVEMGDYAKAEPLYQKALRISEKALGSGHTDTAGSLNNLAGLYMQMGDYAKAESLHQRALRIREKILGPENPDTATSINNLAVLYEHMGAYAKAEPLHQRALRIWEKVLGPEHPNTASSLENLSLLLMDQGSQLEAEALAVKAGQARLKVLANILAFTSEQQRLAYQAHHDPFSLFATLGNASRVAAAMLENKGVVLDSLAEDRLLAEASQNPEDRAAVARIRGAKQRLAQLTLEVPRDLSDQALARRRAEREKLSKEVEELEGQMARRVTGLGRARRALSVTVEQVQAALPGQTALIELLRYRHYLGRYKWEQRYGTAVVMPSGEPKWVCLGAAADIEKNIKTCQQAVRSKTGEKELAASLEALYRQLWSAVETNLPAGTTTIILSPDAQLNFLSFATLLAPDGQFLGQKYSLRYVASGRDLLQEFKPGTTSDLWVYANPDFSGKGMALANRREESGGDTGTTSLAPITLHASRSTELVALRSVEMRDMQSLYLPPLPGTAKESEALAAEAGKAGWPLHVFVGAEATEAQLKAVQSPHILHLATHGFFLPETESEKPDVGDGFRGIGGLSSGLGGGLLEEAGRPGQRPVFLKNPMHRSGLALAGAQATLDAWKRGEVPPMDNDGIVTAEEVGGLKLEGTWLVVLSACDTGLGAVASGEGVLGLRRGFVQAGAQNLLMTLWSVPDEETVKLMVDFYVAAQKSGNAPQALAEVQKDWLVRLRKERGLAAAVNIAGPFIMTSQGPVK